MMKLSPQRSSMLHGVLLIGLFACAAFYIGEADFFPESLHQPYDYRHSDRYALCQFTSQ